MGTLAVSFPSSRRVPRRYRQLSERYPWTNHKDELIPKVHFVGRGDEAIQLEELLAEKHLKRSRSVDEIAKAHAKSRATHPPLVGEQKVATTATRNSLGMRAKPSQLSPSGKKPLLDRRGRDLCPCHHPGIRAVVQGVQLARLFRRLPSRISPTIPRHGSLGAPRTAPSEAVRHVSLPLRVSDVG